MYTINLKATAKTVIATKPINKMEYKKCSL